MRRVKKKDKKEKRRKVKLESQVQCGEERGQETKSKVNGVKRINQWKAKRLKWSKVK